MDILAVREASRWAAEYCRAGKVCVCVCVYRLVSASLPKVMNSRTVHEYKATYYTRIYAHHVCMLSVLSI
jgi:TPP-dependent pyruvate/acetoin dehydrogenase alpha subunit